MGSNVVQMSRMFEYAVSYHMCKLCKYKSHIFSPSIRVSVVDE